MPVSSMRATTPDQAIDVTNDARLRAICDLSVPFAREVVGRHEYDGVVQDLSPEGVRRALAALGQPAEAEPYGDPYDEALVGTAERSLRVRFGELELHRVNPLMHIENLDISCYDRPYAGAEEREAARREHLERWPDAAAAAIEALDRVPAPVARATLPLGRALMHDFEQIAGGVRVDWPTGRPIVSRFAPAHAALLRLLGHLVRAAERGEPSAALGAPALTALLSSSEAVEVNLSRLAEQAETERERIRRLLDEACRRIAPDVDTRQTVKALQADHPSPEQLHQEASALVREVRSWTAEQGLVPYDDGECRVEPMPASRSGPAAMLSAAPYEADGPALFYVNPRERRLNVYFNRAFLAAIALHEVAPGHFSHGRALRRAGSDARRTLLSEAFLEGWAVYAEELALEQGFRSHDPRAAVGVALSALERAVRMECVIGFHTGAIGEADVTRRFREDAFFDDAAARAAAERCTYVPTWVGYTWGKLAIRDLRERARTAWGDGFSLHRFHSALLALGSPPLGLMETALERG
jgi:Bacterial protein of unknown function (DUF885)